MTAEAYVKRTIWEAKCDCGDLHDVRESNPPREKQCPCGKWVPYVENSVIAPNLGLKAYRKL